MSATIETPLVNAADILVRLARLAPVHRPRSLREELGLSQRGLQMLAGQPSGAVARVENGIQAPWPRYRRNVSEVLAEQLGGIDADALRAFLYTDWEEAASDMSDEDDGRL